jgi:hypothetical protein
LDDEKKIFRCKKQSFIPFCFSMKREIYGDDGETLAQCGFQQFERIRCFAITMEAE